MQDRPTPQELLEAVAAFLRDHVVPGTASGQVAFHARVAANALDIVRRQMALAPAAHQREHAALTKLLGAEPGHDVVQLNRLLFERIANGAMDLHTPGLADCLWQITLDKLAVDQPSYETYVRHQRGASSDRKDP
ncbi:MAG TPA: DUF6285 domain-containing protein [Burkholderiaceae bacterium]|nr:DUF6285 domain-containing protein [Burkholderiaceae bacterium]